MTDQVEKSCWGITLWAVAIVLGLVFITTLATAGQQEVASVKIEAAS